MSGPFAKWLALDRRERSQLLLFMCPGLPLVSLLLHARGYARTRAILERFSQTPRRSSLDVPGDIERARRLAWLAEVAGRRGVHKATCLRQSLLVYWCLRRQGWAPELKIGVRPAPAGLEAHAWVELEGESLDASALGYTAFAERFAAL